MQKRKRANIVNSCQKRLVYASDILIFWIFFFFFFFFNFLTLLKGIFFSIFLAFISIFLVFVFSPFNGTKWQGWECETRYLIGVAYNCHIIYMTVPNCVSWHNSQLWKRNETFRVAPGTWDSFTLNKFGMPSLVGKNKFNYFRKIKKNRKKAKHWSLAESSRGIMHQEKPYKNQKGTEERI